MAIVLKPTITISNRAIYTFVLVVILLVLSGIVYAIGSGDHAIHGHDGSEIELDCVTVSKNDCHDEDNCKINCPSGYVVVGCAGGCSGGTDDADFHFLSNGCHYADNDCSGDRIVKARCCRTG